MNYYIYYKLRKEKMNSPRLTYSPKLTLSPRLSQLRKYHISDKLQNFHGKVRSEFVFIDLAHAHTLNTVRKRMRYFNIGNFKFTSISKNLM